MSGWTSALDLLRRTDLTMPSAPAELRDAVRAIVATIDAVTESVLAEPD